MIQAQQQLWQRRQIEGTGWLNVLTRRATLLQETLNAWRTLRRTWRQTRDTAAASSAPGPVLLQIEAALAAIDAAEKPLVAQRVAVLDLQSVVAQEVARCETALTQFTQAQQHAMGGILARDSPPIWSAETWAQARTALPARVREVAADRWADLVSYLHDPSQGMPVHVGIFVVLVVMLSRGAPPGSSVGRDRRARVAPPGLRSPLRRGARRHSVHHLLTYLRRHPPNLRESFEVLALVPVIRLTLPVIDPRLRPELYLLAILFASDSLRQAFGGTPVLEPAILAVEMLAGMAVLVYSLTIGGLRRSSAPEADMARLRAFRAGARLVLLVLAAGAGGGDCSATCASRDCWPPAFSVTARWR